MDKSLNLHNVLSLSFAPQISPIYWFLLLFIGSQNNLIVFFVAITFSSLVQIVSLIVYAKRTNSGFYVADKEKRLPLFLISITAYFIGFVLLEVLKASFIFKALMLAYIINTIIAALITKYLTKISIHVWGISGPSVAILYVYGYYAFAAMLALALIIGYSRIMVKAHSFRQVISAIFLSILITILVIYGLGSYI
ncbi:MAG: hypothetical protein QW046_01640 [Candidatus Micrarchaeaceae archaeon]